jgi:hypothetical protein
LVHAENELVRGFCLQEKTETALTMPEEVAEYAYWYIQSIVNKRLSQKRMLKLLRVWQHKKRAAAKAGDAKVSGRPLRLP